MIQAEHLSKAYTPGAPVLEELSFRALPGELTLFLGSNGVGKSTTLRILSGLLSADRGDVLIAGKSLRTSKREARQRLSYLPQQVAFHPRLSCRAVLSFYAELRGVENITSRVSEMLKLVGLEREAHKSTHALSGGLRQRLGLAVLLVPDAPVLLLDEPGLSLDPEWREKLKVILLNEAAKGKTILLATHLLGEWEGGAHRALQIHPRGRVDVIDPGNLKKVFAGGFL